MVQLKRLVLDILKPHQPNALEFGRILAEQGRHRIQLTVLEMDDHTETLQVIVEGEDIDFPRLQAAIDEFGASLHSVDEVEAVGDGGDGGETPNLSRTE